MIGIRRSNRSTSISNQMLDCAIAKDIPSLRLELMELFKADIPSIVIVNVHKIDIGLIKGELKLNLLERIKLIQKNLANFVSVIEVVDVHCSNIMATAC